MHAKYVTILPLVRRIISPSIALAGHTNLYKFELGGLKKKKKPSIPHIILKVCVKPNDYKLHVIHNTNFV